MNKLRSLVDKLVPILEAEHELQLQMKTLKVTKEALMAEIMAVMTTDSFVTDQVSLYFQDKYVATEEIESDKFKVVKSEWDAETIKKLAELYGIDDSVVIDGVNIQKIRDLRVRFKHN